MGEGIEGFVNYPFTVAITKFWSIQIIQKQQKEAKDTPAVSRSTACYLCRMEIIMVSVLTMFSAFFVEPAPVPPIPNEQQLARLTDYVAFLENWKLWSLIHDMLYTLRFICILFILFSVSVYALQCNIILHFTILILLKQIFQFNSHI